MPGSFGTLIVVMKFHDKFARLRQLKSPDGRDKFQICRINMYVMRFLVNFMVFIWCVYVNFVGFSGFT